MSQDKTAVAEGTGETSALIGIAALLRQSFEGVDLGPLGQTLLARAESNPDDANALLDLSTVLELNGNAEVAQAIQMQALQSQQFYHLPAGSGEPGLRLMAIKGPGELMANTPLEFLIEDSDVALDILYLAPGLPIPDEVPEHDVLFVAVGESDRNQSLLAQLEPLLESWPRPVINRPQRIAQLSRDGACALLDGAQGIVMPGAVRIERETLERIGRQEQALATVADGVDFPCILRPVGSHAGRGLRRIESVAALAGYLDDIPDPLFYLSPFIDYSGEDGLFRKYRVVLVQGRPFAIHMAVSEHWMVHYLNAGMTESEAKRIEEARFMEQFEEGVARRHAEALRELHTRVGLEYFGIDCAETRDGRLLIFEIDSALVVHDMDPVDMFPYKRPAMEKVFTAFRELLEQTRNRN